VAKIRCRKCGATVLVDASTGGGSNGSVAPPGAAPGAWLVNVGEGDERSMQLSEVVDAYNGGVITGETYLWKEGMADWQPLSEITEIVDALNQASAGPVAAAPFERSAGGDGGFSAPAKSTGAARRDQGRSGDMFARGQAEEEVATSVPAHVLAQSRSSFGGAGSQAVAQTSGGMTGTRDEQSVLFSLNALTGGQKPPAAAPSALGGGGGSARNEDSGLIDLNALALAQQARPAEESPLNIAAPSPFMFPAALGTVEAPKSIAPQKSSMPMFIGGGILVAGLAIAVAIFAGGKKEEVPPMPAEAALSAAPVIPTPEVPAAAATAAAPEPAPADSAPAKVVKKATGGGGRAASKAATPTTPAVATPATPLPPPKPKSPCGCAAGDLQCQIRCSATGH
ncbi:MAG: DUF4339 domain-containing protein, partial [Polyangiaceae bacterium]